MHHELSKKYSIMFLLLYLLRKERRQIHFEEKCELLTRIENNKDFVLNLCYQNAVNQKNLFPKFLNRSRLCYTELCGSVIY